MTRRDVFAEWAAIERTRGGRIGAARPDDEPLRFVSSTSLAFPPCDAERAPDDRREWVTHFASLAGSSSDLPPYLAEEIADEDPERPVRLALLAPFHHRAISLLFRSVYRCRIPDVTRSLEDEWPTRLAMVACGSTTSAGATRSIALTIAPLLHGPRSAAALVRALRLVSARWLGDAPIALMTRSGGRAELDPSARARLGRARLGDDALLGTTVLDPARRITLRVGPLDSRHESALDPGEGAHAALASVVGWFADPAVDVDVVLITRDATLVLGATRLGASALGKRDAVRTRPIELDATRRAADRQAPSNDELSASSKEPPHATRSAPARPQAHAHCATPPRERAHERRSLAAC